MNRTELAIKLFNPDENGISRWVYKKECVGEYEDLYPTNGNTWYRNTGLSHYVFEKENTSDGIRWRFNGLKKNSTSRKIKPNIWHKIRNKSCVITGLELSAGHKIEVDHKDGRYPEEVLNVETQTEEDFQPLYEKMNKQKRSDCAKCKETNIRFDAREKGFSVSVIEGSLQYEGTCKGCYWFDVTEFISKLGH
jgi:hypothetical protein